MVSPAGSDHGIVVGERTAETMAADVQVVDADCWAERVAAFYLQCGGKQKRTGNVGRGNRRKKKKEEERRNEKRKERERNIK